MTVNFLISVFVSSTITSVKLDARVNMDVGWLPVLLFTSVYWVEPYHLYGAGVVL